MAVAAVLAVATGAALFFATCGDGVARRPGSVAAPGVTQARWRITTTPAGITSKPDKRERDRVKAQSRVLSPKIRRFFNAMFLYPKNVSAMVKRLFSRSAATALKRSGAGLPRKAKDIKLLKRVAHIGIDVSSASRAAAEVRVVAKGVVRGKRFALQQDANLWLNRQAKSWKVIGFEINQRPWRRTKRGDKRDDKKRDAGREGANERRQDRAKKRGTKQP